MTFHPDHSDANTADLTFVVSVFMFGLIFLCLWTIGVQIAALGAFPFVVLYPIFAVALLVAAVGCRINTSAIFGSKRLQLPNVSIRLSGFREMGLATILILALLTIAFIGTAAIQYKTSNFLPLWIVGIVTAVIALFLSPKTTANAIISLTEPKENTSRLSPFVVFILVSLILLVFYFFTSVPDADDSLFLNFAVGAIRDREALFSADTMLGIPGLNFMKSTYRLETYQLLAALISDVTGLSVIMAAHAIIPAVVLIWTASVFVLLHHAIFRASFFVTILFHLAVLIAIDGTFRSYGYHAIPRFFQGKGPFVTTMVPLIAFLTVSALRDNRWKSIFLLAAAIVISTGLTANAIYAGPFTAALVALPFLFGPAGTRLRPFRLILIIIYPAFLAGFLLTFDPPPNNMHHDISAAIGSATAIGQVGRILWGLLGTPYMHAVSLGLIFLATVSAFTNVALRPVSIYALGLLLFVMNPFFWDIFHRSVTGGNNYRLLWALPLPFVLALIAGVLWGTRLLAIRALVVVVLAGLAVAPGSIFYKADLGFALLKVPTPEYEIAKTTNDIADSSDIILAPEEISAWIPTLDNAHPVVESRALYLSQRIEQFSPEKLEQRATLFRYWSPETPVEQLIEFRALMNALSVSVIVVDTEQPSHTAVSEIIRSLGFTTQTDTGKYQIMKREK